MKDFLGVPIYKDNYLACVGLGPHKREHGLILHKVLDVLSDHIKTVRIKSYYITGEDHSKHPWKEQKVLIQDKNPRRIIALRDDIDIYNTNETVVINPPEKVKILFEKILNLDPSVFETVSSDALWKWNEGQSPETNFLHK